MEIVKGADVQPGMVIESAHHWYTVISVEGVVGRFSAQVSVSDSRGQMGPLLVGLDDDYPMRWAGGVVPDTAKGFCRHERYQWAADA